MSLFEKVMVPFHPLRLKTTLPSLGGSVDVAVVVFAVLVGNTHDIAHTPRASQVMLYPLVHVGVYQTKYDTGQCYCYYVMCHCFKKTDAFQIKSHCIYTLYNWMNHI